MVNIRRREHDLIRTQVTLIVANVEPAGAFNHQVDLVRARVRVTPLLLTRLETIDLGEHPFGLEQIHLLHLLRGETAFGLYVPGFHLTTPVASDLDDT